MKQKGYLIKAEFLKIRYRKMGLITAASMGFMALWLWYSLTSGSDIRPEGYSVLLYDMGILQTLFMPLTLAMVASRLCDAEHKGSVWKLLYTMEEREWVYDFKIVIGSCYVVLLVFIQAFIIISAGLLLAVTQPLPVKELLYWLVGSLALSEGLFLLQLILAYCFENQLIPLMIGLLGSFLGLFALYLPQIYKFIPWCYYAVLTPVTMDWNKETRSVHYFLIKPDEILLMVIICLVVLVYWFGKCNIAKKEAFL